MYTDTDSLDQDQTALISCKKKVGTDTIFMFFTTVA